MQSVIWRRAAWTAAAAGVLLRCFGARYFEFKSEQAIYLLTGLEMPERCFGVLHGMTSSVGVPNGPGMYLLTGLIALCGGRTPEQFAAVTAGLSIAAVALFGLLVRRQLGRRAALTAAVLLAACPVLIWLSGNLWPQNFIVLPMLGELALAAGALRGRRWCWAAGVWLAAAIGMVHLSGFFLLPGWAAIRLLSKRRFDLAENAAAAAGALLICAPWLTYLATGWDRQLFPDPTSGWRKTGMMLWEYAGAFGGGFLQEYYGWDLAEPFGGRRWLTIALLLPAAVIPWIGVGRALGEARRRKLPPAVTAAAMLAGSVLAGYALLRVHVYFFYLPLPLPALALLAAYGFSRFRRRCWRLGLPALWAAAALSLTALAQWSVIQGGGHPREYGIGYGWWRDFGAELAELERREGPLNVQLVFDRSAQNKVDAGTVHYLLGRYFRPEGRPIRIEIVYDRAVSAYRRRVLPPR